MNFGFLQVFFKAAPKFSNLLGLLYKVYLQALFLNLVFLKKAKNFVICGKT